MEEVGLSHLFSISRQLNITLSLASLSTLLVRYQVPNDPTMARRKRVFDDADDSDTSYSPEDDDIFDRDEDINQDSDLETDITDPNDLGVNDVDVDDQLLLFDGNAHPPQYYRNGIENFNEVDIENGDYVPGTEKLLDAIQEAWRGLFANRDHSWFLLTESAGFATQSASFVVIAWLARALRRSPLPFSKTSSTGS